MDTYIPESPPFDDDAPMTVPFEREAEEALIGSILMDGERLRYLDTMPEEFYFVRHRWIWEAMHALRAANQSIDVLTVTTELDRHKRAAEVGGFNFLMDLVQRTPPGMYTSAYARLIREAHQRRRILDTVQQAAQAALNKARPVDEIIAAATTDLANVAMQSGADGTQPYSFFLSRHYDRIDDMAQHPEIKRGMQTGFRQFDFITGGIFPSEFIIFYGKPKVRKTQFLQQLAAQLVEAGQPGVFYQLETPEETIMDRDVSRFSLEVGNGVDGIKTDHLDNPEQMTDAEWALYTGVMDRYSRLPLLMNFDPQTTVSIEADASRQKTEHGIKWVMIDYMGLLCDERQRGEDEPRWEARIARQLKRMSRRTGLSVIVIHTMNKEGMKSAKPSLTDGSGAAGIQYDCDKAIFITEHIPEPNHKPEDNMRTFIIEASRRAIKRKAFSMVVLPHYPKYSDPPMTGGTP
jgi:replicative DNA helicase